MTEEELSEMRNRAWRLFAEGNGAYEKCDYERSRELYANALILLSGLAETTKASEDRSMLLAVRNGYGNAAMALLDYPTAKKAYTGTLELYESLTEKSIQDAVTADSAASSLSHISRQAYRDMRAAIIHMSRAAVIEKKIIEMRNLTGDWRRFRRTLTELSRMKGKNGDEDAASLNELALGAAKRTLAKTGEDQDRREVARLLLERGISETDSGKLSEAEDTFSDALDEISAVYRRSDSEDDQRIYSSILMERGRLAERSGSMKRAADYYALTVSPMEDLAERTGMNDDRSRLRYLALRLGIALDSTGETEKAYVWYRKASDMTEELGTYDIKPALMGRLQEILLSEAEKLLREGSRTEAMRCLMNAWRSERDTANHSGLEQDWKRLYDTLMLMGRMNAEDTDYEASLDFLSEAWYVLKRLRGEHPDSSLWKREEIRCAHMLSVSWKREENYEENRDWPTKDTDWEETAISKAEALSSSEDAEERRMLPWLLIERSEIAREDGDLEKAGEHAERAADILSKMTETDPTTEDLRLFATAAGLLGAVTPADTPAFRERLARKSADIYTKIADRTGETEDRAEASKYVMMLSEELMKEERKEEAEEAVRNAIDKALETRLENGPSARHLLPPLLHALFRIGEERGSLSEMRDLMEAVSDRLGVMRTEEVGKDWCIFLGLLIQEKLKEGERDEALSSAKDLMSSLESYFGYDRKWTAEGMTDLIEILKDNATKEEMLPFAETAANYAERADRFSSTAESRMRMRDSFITAAEKNLENGNTDKALSYAEKALPVARERARLYDTPDDSLALIKTLFIISDTEPDRWESMLLEAIDTAENEAVRPLGETEKTVTDGDENIRVFFTVTEETLRENLLLRIECNDRMTAHLEASDRERDTVQYRMRAAELSRKLIENDGSTESLIAYSDRIEDLEGHLSALREWKNLRKHLISGAEAAEMICEKEKTPENLERLAKAELSLAECLLKLESPEASEWNRKASSHAAERSRSAKETPLSVALRAAATAQLGELEYQETEDPARPIERYREAWNTEFEITVKSGEFRVISHMLHMLEKTERYYGLLGREREGEDFVLSRFRDLSERLGHGPWETLPEARAFGERRKEETEESTFRMPPASPIETDTEEPELPAERGDLASLDLDSLLSGGSLLGGLGDLSSLTLPDDIAVTDIPEMKDGTVDENDEKKSLSTDASVTGEDPAEDERHKEAVALYEHAVKGWMTNRKELRKARSIWEELPQCPLYQEWMEKVDKAL